MKSIHRAVVTAALFTLALAAPARATMVVGKDFDDLCREADMIFAGRVTSVDSHWQDDRHQSIETEVTFAVTDAVFGVDSRELRLSFAGGDADGLRQVVDGMPQFRVGEEVVLFATRKHAVSPIVGFHQGCFRVVDDEVLNVDGTPVTSATARGLALEGSGGAAQEGIAVGQFLDTVRARVADREGTSR